jgi:hypothetical protein
VTHERRDAPVDLRLGMPNARKERLLQELPADDDASAIILLRCAACVAMLALGAGSLDTTAHAAFDTGFDTRLSTRAADAAGGEHAAARNVPLASPVFD